MSQLFAKILLLMIPVLMTASIAFAGLTLEAAKTQGLVGERPDGLVGIVAGGTADITTLVESTNAERLDRYRKIAERNGTPLDQVQAPAGKKLIEKSASGEYIMSASGSWQKK